MTIFLIPNLNKSNKENLYWQLSANPSKEPIGLIHIDGVITENTAHQTNYIIHCLNNENIFTFEYTPPPPKKKRSINISTRLKR